MAKTKKLNNVEKLAIQGLVLQGKDAISIAKEIDRPTSMINNYLVELRDALAAIDENKNPKPKKKEKAPPKKRPIAKDFIINRTSEKGDKGVSIMTRTASERIDEHRKTVPSNAMRKSVKEYLHKITEE